MLRNYKKVLTKIKQTENHLKSCSKTALVCEPTCKNSFILRQNSEIIEEIKDLKENINAKPVFSQKLVYQPISIKSRK